MPLRVHVPALRSRGCCIGRGKVVLLLLLCSTHSDISATTTTAALSEYPRLAHKVEGLFRWRTPPSLTNSFLPPLRPSPLLFFLSGDAPGVWTEWPWPVATVSMTPCRLACAVLWHTATLAVGAPLASSSRSLTTSRPSKWAWLQDPQGVAFPFKRSWLSKWGDCSWLLATSRRQCLL